jgi:hypothetical protein
VCSRIAGPSGLPDLRKGETMNRVSGFVCKLALAGVLFVFILLPLGCSFDQLGETEAEGSRRHDRIARINRQEMMSDIDRFLLLDKPSKLTDKRIP